MSASGSEAETITLKLDDDLVARLEAFRSQNGHLSDDAHAVREILRRWLRENGFDGPHDDAGTRPEALNSANDG
ncbi:ribbon-helix-helix domain-containing protein [Pararhizobium mangrovi]|uniref:Uncharacterized protein n=1 Tax=Pararhizobium mangrovi TaxID=2590452 RepID=A0A506TZV0_9HYPH|nr:hypothetical protein [Pararhizobium mangrovi]TPW27040.1 hypothetical protein FJU11_12930 [Pararhizobium mangrovi]